MRVKVFIILSILSIMIVSASGCTQTSGIVDEGHYTKAPSSDTASINIAPDGNVVFNLNNTEAILTGSLIQFIKYNPETLESHPEYMYIINNSINAPDYFKWLFLNNEHFGFTLEFNRTAHPEYGDFELSAVIIEWSNGMMTPVTNYFNVTTELSADHIWRIINIDTTPMMRASLQYYASKGEIKSLIVYLHTTIKGKSKFIRITIDPKDIEADQ